MSLKNWAYLIALGTIWGTSYTWIKIAVAEISPPVLVGIRTALGALALLVLLRLGKTGRLRWQEARPVLGVFTLMGLINVALPFVLISWSEQTIDSGLASILLSTSPLFTILIASMFLPDERFRLAKLAGLVVGFAGVVVLILPEVKRGGSQNISSYAGVLLASLAYAVAGVYARRKIKEGLSPIGQAFMQLCAASLLVWGFAAGVERPLIFPVRPLTWLALLWLGLLGSCAAYVLYFSLLHAVGITKTSMVSYIAPLISVVMGAVLLGERFHWQVLLGGLLILSGVAITGLQPGVMKPVKMLS